ncbi:hypothetical protein [Rhizocola hellebori]|uniref:hypothetical protein n=1 Tax=Rhizocola hellebori TaxID=1392758 RepID=UPI0019424AD5|nr:hypothetical protein [Rhizocola hellebori]
MRQQLSKLFPETEARPRPKRALLWSALAVFAGTIVSLARTTGAGPFQTIWEEDARDLLTDALMSPTAYNLVKPYVGYFQVGPRIMGEVAALFPISWAAAILSIQAAMLCAVLALGVYIASGTHLRHPLARFLVSAPMLFSPTAENWASEIYNRPATIQFFLVYAMFWFVLWVPGGRAGRIVQVAAIGMSAISTFLVVILIPLAVVRLWVRRDRLSLMMAGLLTSGLVIQMAGLYFGLTDRNFASPRQDPFWALQSFVLWAMPHSMLGWNQAWMLSEHPVSLDHVLRAVVAWLIVLAAVAVAFYRLTRPRWLLAAVAFAHAVALACMTIMANGMITQRYLLPVEMLIFTALAALLIPASRPMADRRAFALAHAPLAVLTCFLLLVSAVNYRHNDTYRHKGPLWTQQVKLGAESCSEWSARREVTLRSGPAPYYSLVVVPCHVFRTYRWCEWPYCVQIDDGVPDSATPRKED